MTDVLPLCSAVLGPISGNGKPPVELASLSPGEVIGVCPGVWKDALFSEKGLETGGILNVRPRGVMGGESLCDKIPEGDLECWVILLVSFSPSDTPSPRANFADFRGLTGLSAMGAGARDMEGGRRREGRTGRDGRGERRRAFKPVGEKLGYKSR